MAAKVANADKTVVQFSALTDAAFSRTCGNDLLAVRRISPNQPFKRNIGRPFQTDISLRLDRTRTSGVGNEHFGGVFLADTTLAKEMISFQLLASLFGLFQVSQGSRFAVATK